MSPFLFTFYLRRPKGIKLQKSSEIQSELSLRGNRKVKTKNIIIHNKVLVKRIRDKK